MAGDHMRRIVGSPKFRKIVLALVILMALGLVWSAAWCWGSWACARSSWIVLDSASDTVTVHALGFFGSEQSSFPLAQVRHAQIDTGDPPAERIVLILQSGRHWGWTGFSDRDGQEEAVQAINDFLGAPGG